MNHVQRPLPKPLQRLTELAFDLRLVGSKTMSQVWRRLDPEAWIRCNNPYMILQHAHQSALEHAAADEALIGDLDEWFERQDRYMTMPGWFGEHHAGGDLKGVAYFSMEFGLSEALPIYSGGLGILAGDHLKSASDLNVPLIGIGLLYQQGYFRQVLADDGWQLEAFPFNDPGSLPVTPVLDPDGRWPRVRLELPGRTLFLRVWQAQVGKVSLYLLDSNHPLNGAWDRGITANLYAAGKETRLLQELVLGVGGWRLLEMLGADVQVCHLNEGHAAFAVVARAASFAERHKVPFGVALRATRAGNVFTTHTPVEAAFDCFEPALLVKYAEPFIKQTGLSDGEFLAMGRRDARDEHEPFNMAYLALRGSCHINGVAKLHARVSRRLFQPLFPGRPEAEVPIGAITNGVHVPTWHSEPANRLWSQAGGGRSSWLADVARAAGAVEQLPDADLWDYRADARQTLVEYVRHRLQRQLLEDGIAPEFYARDDEGIPRAWIRRVRHSMTRLTAQFSSDRMVREYVEQAYLPAARNARDREAEGARQARELEAWQALIDDQWNSLRFGRLAVTDADGQWRFDVHVMFGGLPPAAAQVQVYADPVDGAAPTCVVMQPAGPLHGIVNGFSFRAQVPADRPSGDYTPRVIAYHPGACVPCESTRCLWFT